MFFGGSSCLLLTLGVASVVAEKWRWPEEARTLRIDTKVRFFDEGDRETDDNRENSVQADEPPFEEPTDTDGFYNRPPGDGRYPVRVEQQRGRLVHQPHKQNVYSDGTLDSLQYCKCLTTPLCKPRNDIPNACGAGKYLCCYKRPNKNQKTEFFNEVEDERPMLFPGRGNLAGPFPPPPNNAYTDEDSLGGVSGGRQGSQRGTLVGPGGPTGNIGPPIKPGDSKDAHGRPAVLVGPQGPTGVIGPPKKQSPDVLVGPDGPTGDIGPSASAQRGVLVGPGGPTGIIGPGGFNQQPILVGPGGPTGYIGPIHGAQRPGVLVGPGGPTGVIGPGNYGRQIGRPGILIGPGGPTGIIGPGRQILVGPGGPTGQIGPRNPYFGCSRRRRKEAKTTPRIKSVVNDEKKANGNMHLF